MSAQILSLAAIAIFCSAGAISFLFGGFSRKLALKYNALDIPKDNRKIQKRPIPLWGGLGIGATIIIGIILLWLAGSMITGKVGLLQLLGFIAAIIFLNIGGAIDDIRDLKAWQIFPFPLLAAVTVVLTGTTIVHVTDPTTSLPWFLNSWQFPFWGGALNLSFPGDLIAVVWLLIATYATKLTDGLDGLVTGIAVIGASMVGLLSAMPVFYRPSTTVLAALVAGSFAGFLPHNRHSAKQYLGEGGSTLAGFSLGFLAIVSSAKVAIALAVLAIPIADIAFVVLRRVLEHRPWFKGDSTHLHFRLLAAGMPHGRAVHLFWLISASAGFAALFLQTRGKLFLVFILIILTLLISWLADRAIQRKLPNPKNENR